MIRVINPVYMIPGDRYKHVAPSGEVKEVTFIAVIEDPGFGRMRVMGSEDRLGRTSVFLVHTSGLVAGEGRGYVNFSDESLNTLTR